MKKVVTTIPKKRMDRYGVEVLKDIELVYLDAGVSQEKLLEEVRDADFLFSSLTEINREIIEKAKKLKLIQSEGVGYDDIDIEAAREQGIYVSNARGVNKDPVAEFTIGLMIDLLRRITASNNSILKDEYKKFYKNYENLKIKSLTDCKIGIVGLGDIGLEVVKRLLPFTDDLVYFNRTRKKNLELYYSIEYMELEELYKKCDIISLHLPLNKKTKYMINKESIGLMKDDAIIINTSRGDLIQQDDLAEALLENKLGGAGLDTMSPEPPNMDHPLLNLPEEIQSRIVLTSHIAGVTADAFAQMQEIGWRNIEKVIKGQRPDNIVNKL